MSRLGFGFGGRSARTALFTAGTGGASDVILSPGAAWDGTAGSGFGSPPSDPARITAKPAMRLLTPPHQWFAHKQTIGVYAGANNNGSLLDNMGLEKVIVHYEGATREILAPSFHSFDDANGNAVTYYGWWLTLRHNGIDGAGHVYFEAVPKDTTMQNRVMGPYTYRPGSGAVHDYEIEVAATPSEVIGSRYKTVFKALTYLKSVSAKRPRITITETALYDLATVIGGFYNAESWCVVEASVPVSFGRASYTGDGTAALRPRYDKLRFKGSNICFDFANVIQYYTDVNQDVWFDGVKIINSLGRTRLYRKGPPNQAWMVRENPYFTECNISDVQNCCSASQLVRGGNFAGIINDPFTDARCVIGTTMDRLDNEHLNTDVPALTAQYSGAGASATLEISSFSDATARTLTAKVDGASVGTFTVLNSQAASDANTNYTVQNVVDWLNGLSGWSASTLDNSRRATALSALANKGAAFGATDAKSAPLTLVTMFDLHVDWFAQNYAGVGENVVLANNTAINIRGQDVFISAGFPVPKDFLVINNAFSNRFDNPTTYDTNNFLASQLGGTAHSHMVIVHNSWAGQGMLLRTDQAGYKPDPYCLLANNAVRSISWTSTPDADLTIANNHLQTGQTVPAGSSGTSVGGDHTSLFAQEDAGDFMPAGELLANLKVPVVRYDQGRVPRGAGAAAGALA